MLNEFLKDAQGFSQDFQENSLENLEHFAENPQVQNFLLLNFP